MMKYLRWLYRYSQGVRLTLLLNMLLGTLAVGLNLFFIWVCKRLVDVATGNSSGDMYALCIVIACAIVMRILFNALNARLESITQVRMNFLMRSRLFTALLKSRWDGREKYHSGDSLNRLFTDVDTVSSVICQEVPAFFTTMVQLCAAFVFLARMDLRLAVALVLIMPLFVLLSRLCHRVHLGSFRHTFRGRLLRHDDRVPPACRADSDPLRASDKADTVIHLCHGLD